MNVQVQITDGPLLAAPPEFSSDGAGAIVRFDGIVRPMEGDRPIVALEYQAYQPMASDILRTLAADAVQRFGLLGVCVEHGSGRIMVGQCSFRLRIAGEHRAEALNAMRWFIGVMKQDAPIWKKAVLVDSAGSSIQRDPDECD